MKTLTTKEAINLLSEVGFHSHVTVEVDVNEHEVKDRAVLNDGMVYDPIYGNQLGTSNSQQNAESAIEKIRLAGTSEFTIFSSYFSWANGLYAIQD